MEPFEVETTGVAVGGAAIARDADGRVLFVEGALVGERVLVDVVEDRRSFRRARVLDVVEASPSRVEPSCPEVAAGCGGCDRAYADHAEQQTAKATMVHDALTRIGRIDAPPIGVGPALATTGFRTTVRAAVRDGRAGLRARRSHDLVAVRSCRVAHPLVEELLVGGRFGDASEVTIRVGARTGERMVVTDGDPLTADLPADVVVVSPTDSTSRLHEDVAGHRFAISPRSFFQTRTDGADALVAEVGAAVAGFGLGPEARLVDLCCGVGLFAAAFGPGCSSVVAVESNRSAVADATDNLAFLGERATVVRSSFETWVPEPADVVVADPSRAGLGRAGVDAVVGTGAAGIVLVSCDAGSLGRDAGLLVGAGYGVTSVTLVDLFPDTSHVEVVSRFERV